MYKALVRSHLDYCDTIYHMLALNNQTNLGVTLTSLMETVEQIQYQVALDITGTWQGSNRSKLYEELGWKIVVDVGAFFRYINNMTPSHLRDKLPPNRRLFL